MSDSDSSSSDEFLPVGLSSLNLQKMSLKHPQTVSVLVKKTNDDTFNLIPELQYESLLNRAEEYFKKNTNGGKKNIKLVVTRRNRKTQINIVEIAKQLNRQEGQLTKYVLKGLYTEGTVNEKGVLNIDGRYVQSEVENILKSFINEYVVCKSCESIDDTEIIKKNRLFFVKCNACQSERCVGNTVDGLNVSKLK